jgi:hypothetical protein
MRRQKALMVVCAGVGCGRSLPTSGPGYAGYDVSSIPSGAEVVYSVSSEYLGAVLCSTCGTFTRFVSDSSEFPSTP